MQVVTRTWTTGQPTVDTDVREIAGETELAAFMAANRSAAREWGVSFSTEVDGKLAEEYHDSIASPVSVTYLSYSAFMLQLRSMGRTAAQAQRIVGDADNGKTARIVGDSLTATLTEHGYRLARVC